MRAAIVEREDVPALVHEKDRAMAAVHNKSALGFQLLKGAGANEIRGLSIHGRLIRQAVRGNAIQQGLSPICQSSLRFTSSVDQRESAVACRIKMRRWYRFPSLRRPARQVCWCLDLIRQARRRGIIAES
jgi:hypothetical protein